MRVTVTVVVRLRVIMAVPVLVRVMMTALVKNNVSNLFPSYPF